MAKRRYVLTDEDRNDIVKDIEARMKQRVNVPSRGFLPHEEWSADVHVAIPPCGECIPKRVGRTPGHKECCIFKIVHRTVTSDGTTRIDPKLILEGNLKSVRRKIVYNTWPWDACPVQGDEKHGYILVGREKNGPFMVLHPREEVTTTSSTSTPPPSGSVFIGTEGAAQSNCVGDCRWEWNHALQLWEKDLIYEALNGGCNTTTSTSSSSSSTTTTTCACPTTTSSTTTTSTSSTSSTSTTTTPECDCLPPNFCGSETCEVTYTPCASGVSVYVPPACSSTTTSTTSSTTSSTSSTTPGPCSGDCAWEFDGVQWNLFFNTCAGGSHCVCSEAPTEEAEAGETALTFCGTTTTPDPCASTSTCGVGCTYYCHPVYGWILKSRDCDPPCECELTSALPECIECTEATLLCTSSTSTATPAPPICQGSCEFIWLDSSNAWLLAGYGCTITGNCNCAAPSSPGGDDCVRTSTPCVTQTTSSTSSTSTPPPCGTTTSTSSTSSTSTTTTPNCATGHCKWRNELGDNNWILDESTCPLSCACTGAGPTHEGDACEVMVLPCPPATTTTSSTTTTTTTTTSTSSTSSSSTSTTCVTGWWCDPGDNLCKQATDICPPNIPYGTEAECLSESSCNGTLSTTTSTTTTSSSSSSTVF